MDEETPNLTIKFPFSLDYNGARELCRYLESNLDGGIEIDFCTRRSEIFGTICQDEKGRVRIIGEELTGSIRRRSPRQSADFSFNRTYDKNEHLAYTGLEFNVTPGTTPGELPTSDSPVLMSDARKVIEDYFK